jgi:hypothetical protein
MTLAIEPVEEPESEPALITQAEWNALRYQVWDMHRIILDLRDNVKPALEQIASGGIFSALMGRTPKSPKS